MVSYERGEAAQRPGLGDSLPEASGARDEVAQVADDDGARSRTAVGCHDGFDGALRGATPGTPFKPPTFAFMSTYVLEPIVTPATLRLAPAPDKPVVAPGAACPPAVAHRDVGSHRSVGSVGGDDDKAAGSGR